MIWCSTFGGPLPARVSSLFAACSGLYWLPFSFVLSTFIWRISFITCYWECCMDCSTSMKKFTLSTRTLCCYCGPTLVPLAPSSWLGWYWWGIVGLDSAYDGIVLMFRVVFDLRCITCKGLICLPCPFPNSRWSHQFKCGEPFCISGLDCFLPLCGPIVLG